MRVCMCVVVLCIMYIYVMYAGMSRRISRTKRGRACRMDNDLARVGQTRTSDSESGSGSGTYDTNDRTDLAIDLHVILHVVAAHGCECSVMARAWWSRCVST